MVLLARLTDRKEIGNRVGVRAELALQRPRRRDDIGRERHPRDDDAEVIDPERVLDVLECRRGSWRKEILRLYPGLAQEIKPRPGEPETVDADLRPSFDGDRLAANHPLHPARDDAFAESREDRLMQLILCDLIAASNEQERANVARHELRREARVARRHVLRMPRPLRSLCTLARTGRHCTARGRKIGRAKQHSVDFAIPAPERNARRRIALGRRLRRAAIALSNRWIALELYYQEARAWHRLRHTTRTQAVIALARRYAQRVGDRELVASAAAWALIYNIAPANLRIRIALADEWARLNASYQTRTILKYIVAAAFELEDVDVAVSYMAELELALGQHEWTDEPDDVAMMSILCGDLCVLQNDWREAFRCYRAAYILHPEYYDSALCRLVFVLQKLGRPRLADRVFHAVVARKKAASREAPGISVWKTDEVYFLAQRFLERRDFQSACEVLELRRVSSSAVLFQAWGPQLWPHRARVALAAAYALSEVGRTDEARAELDTAIGDLEALGHPMLTVAQSLRAKMQTPSSQRASSDTRNAPAT